MKTRRCFAGSRPVWATQIMRHPNPTLTQIREIHSLRPDIHPLPFLPPQHSTSSNYAPCTLTREKPKSKPPNFQCTSTNLFSAPFFPFFSPFPSHSRPDTEPRNQSAPFHLYNPSSKPPLSAPTSPMTSILQLPAPSLQPKIPKPLSLRQTTPLNSIYAFIL